MRVLHVIPSTAERDGGPSTAVRSMARALSHGGAEVTVATTNADGAGTLDVALDRPTIEDGVTYRYFSRTMPGEWKFSWPLTTWLLRNASAFDVVHVHALFSYSTIPGCRGAARRQVPYVLRPLGTLGEWSLRHRGWKKRPYFRLIESSHLTSAAAIHATSEEEAESIRALGFGARVRVIPLGVDVPVPPIAREARAEHPLRLLFMSRLHPVKGLPILLEAVRRAGQRARDPVDLIIAGEGEPAYERELRGLVAALGLTDQVRFAGHVNGDAKRRLLEWADVFVLPSHHENFGIAVAEALAASLPVIVSDQVGIATEVARAHAGLVVPVEADAIASAIASLAADPVARWDAGSRGAALARERWSWERSGAALRALYDELVERRRLTA